MPSHPSPLQRLRATAQAHPQLTVSRAEVADPVAPAALEAAEQAAGLTLPDSLRALYTAAGGLKLAWSLSLDEAGIAAFFAGDTEMAGAVHVPSPAAALTDALVEHNERILFHPRLVDISAFRAIDIAGTTAVVALPVEDDHLADTPMLLTPGRPPSPLCDSVDSYVEALHLTLGLDGWQMLLAEPDGDTPALRALRHYLTAAFGCDVLDALRGLAPS